MMVLFTILASCSGNKLEKLATERSDLYFRAMVFERATRRNITIDDFKNVSSKVIASNDSLCVLELMYSIKERGKNAVENIVYYGLIKDMGLSRVKGEDVYKEYSDDSFTTFEEFAEWYKGTGIFLQEGKSVMDAYCELMYDYISEDDDAMIIEHP